jgi:hypothetical protein
MALAAAAADSPCLVTPCSFWGHHMHTFHEVVLKLRTAILMLFIYCGKSMYARSCALQAASLPPAAVCAGSRVPWLASPLEKDSRRGCVKAPGAGPRSHGLCYMQLLVGKLPRAGVLERHRLGQYAAIANAVRSGSIGDLNRALVGSQRRFIMEVMS